MLLRKINRARWLPLEDSGWLPNGEIPADPLSDLATSQGRLSVWVISPDRSNLDRVIGALAGNCDYLSNVDYVLFDEGLVTQLGLKTTRAPGNSPDSEANGNWHQDIVELTAARMAALAKAVYAFAKPGDRRSPKQVRRLLEDAIRNNWVDRSRLKETLASRLSPKT